MNDFARAFHEAAQAEGIRLQFRGTLRWLSGKGHLDAEAGRAPLRTRQRLAQIHAALGGREELLEAKRLQAAPVDFLVRDTIVELDEFQHFSTPRLASLNHYEGFVVGFDVARYKDLCRVYAASADAYRRAKTARDFPFSGGRTAQRAYLDACRDLLGPAFGMRVLRVPAPESDVSSALSELRTALEAAGVPF